MRYWKYLEDRKIVELLDQGHAPKQVASIVGVSVWIVYRSARRYVSREALPKIAKKKACVSPVVIA